MWNSNCPYCNHEPSEHEWDDGSLEIICENECCKVQPQVRDTNHDEAGYRWESEQFDDYFGKGDE